MAGKQMIGVVCGLALAASGWGSPNPSGKQSVPGATLVWGAAKASGEEAATTPQADAIEEGRAALGAGDYAKALRLLLPPAKKGHPVAQNGVGVLYLNGWGVKQDFKEALEWFRKAAAQGEPRGQFNLGWMYDQGQGVAQDYVEAARLYRKAADNGYPPAQTLLASMYARGDGVPQDYAEAMKWYRQAAEQGDVIAQSRVGFMFVEGQGVAKDYGEAERWFRQAAAQEHPFGYYWLGRLHFEGWGRKKDAREAVRWLEKAATQGMADAQDLLGRIYSEGGEEQDNVKAILWLRRASAQGHSESAKLLREKYQTTATEGPVLVTVEQALQAPPEELAKAYLVVSYLLVFLQPAREGEFRISLHTSVDGKQEVITESNALIYLAGYEDRLRVYSQAIQQRGFQKLGGAYDTKFNAGCRSLIPDGESVLTQDGFEVKWAHSEVQGELRHRGVVVGNVLAFEHAMNPEIILSGRKERDGITLQHAASKCEVRLRAK